MDVAEAIRQADRLAELPDLERAWLDLLREELEPELRTLDGTPVSEPTRVSANFDIGTWAVAGRHRDLLRAEGTSALFGFGELDLAAEFPSVASALRFRWDGWFLNDPQFPDGTVVEEHPNFLGSLDFAGRLEDGYLELQLPYFRLLAGRLYRNWGLAQTHGLLVSSYPYSYDQLGYRIGSDRLSVTGFVAQLDEFPGSVKRWFSAHRLDWRVRENLAVAFGETTVYGGENRSFDFRQANPIAIWLVGGFGKDYEEGPNANNSFSEISAWWRPIRGMVTYVSLMFDDFPGGGSPAAYGAHLTVHFPNLSPRTGLRLDYTQVAALTYRSIRPYEIYSFRNIGLGRDVADHDLASVQLDWFPSARLMLRPVVQMLRRGEGDFRDPWPDNVTSSGPTLFIGELETTWRFALRGLWRPGRRAWMEWDLGENLISNVGHELGQSGSKFAARVRLSITTRITGEF
jgi:hypothetical protein